MTVDLMAPSEAESDPGHLGNAEALVTGFWNKLVTGIIVAVPLVALGAALVFFWHHGVGWFDMGLAAALYVFTGVGISLGFHRLFTHRSFRAHRGLRIALAVAGSLAAEGSLISWVSNHRRHHVFADRSGDPHSPWTVSEGSLRRLRGLFHAHMGWLFSSSPSGATRWSSDLLADRDVVAISRLAPLWTLLTLALPFGIGWAVTRSMTGALLAMLWAGAIRIGVLHHVTWSVNSLGHMFGKRPFRSADRSGNIAWLSVISFGDSWHNSHHAFPGLARHGCDRAQLDPSAALLRVFEGLGWATKVRWPSAAVLARRRLPVALHHSPDAGQPA